MKQAGSWSIILLGAVLSTGCYTYNAVDAARPGMEIRARLKTEAAVKRSAGLDEPIMRLDGIVVESTAEAISLNILVARSSSVFQEAVIRDTVRLETSEIQSLMARKFSPGRTLLVSVGSVAAAAAIIAGIDQVVGGTDEPNDPGDPTFTPRLFSWKNLRLLLSLRH